MLQPYRDHFNAHFTPAKYDDLLARLNRLTRTSIEFRVAETPCFFSRSSLDELAETGAELTRQLLDNPAYIQASNQTIPEPIPRPQRKPHPQLHDRRLRPRPQLRRLPQPKTSRTPGLPLHLRLSGHPLPPIHRDLPTSIPTSTVTWPTSTNKPTGSSSAKSSSATTIPKT